MWETISLNDLKEDDVYKFESHSAKVVKGVHWLMCIKCGLLYLRNDITRRCIRWGCNSDIHPEYIRWRNKK